MSDIEKNTNLYDIRSMVFGGVAIALGLSMVPAEVKNYFNEGSWNMHVAEEASISCRYSFGRSSQITFPMKEDFVISANEANECYLQKVEELNAEKGMLGSKSGPKSGALILSFLVAGFGAGGFASGANSIRKRYSKDKTLTPS